MESGGCAVLFTGNGVQREYGYGTAGRAALRSCLCRFVTECRVAQKEDALRFFGRYLGAVSCISRSGGAWGFGRFCARDWRLAIRSKPVLGAGRLSAKGGVATGT